MGSKPWAPAMTREEFYNRVKERDTIQHNIYQIDLWLKGTINDKQLVQNIREGRDNDGNN